MVNNWMDIWFYHRLSSSEFIYVLNDIVFVICQLLLYYIILYCFPHFTVHYVAFWLPWVCIFRFREYFILLTMYCTFYGGACGAMIGARSCSLCAIIWSWVLFISSLYILVDFSWFSIDWTHHSFYLIIHRIMLSCVGNLYIIL